MRAARAALAWRVIAKVQMAATAAVVARSLWLTEKCARKRMHEENL